MSCVQLSIHTTAWGDRAGRFVFVAVPDQRGRYLRTDRSVVLVPCSLCNAIKGEPCKSKQGYSGSTHANRRSLATRLFGNLPQQDDVIEPVDPKAPEPSAPESPRVEFAEIPPIVIRPKTKILGSVMLIEPRAL